MPKLEAASKGSHLAHKKKGRARWSVRSKAKIVGVGGIRKELGGKNHPRGGAKGREPAEKRACDNRPKTGALEDLTGMVFARGRNRGLVSTVSRIKPPAGGSPHYAVEIAIRSLLLNLSTSSKMVLYRGVCKESASDREKKS